MAVTLVVSGGLHGVYKGIDMIFKDVYINGIIGY